MTSPSEHRAPADSILEVIGRTPTVRLERASGDGARVFAKLELFAPNSSSGDRLAAALLDAARLAPGTPVFEAGPGGAELGLSMLCRMRGHPFTAVLPEGVSLERVQLLRAYGSRVERSPFEQGPAGAVAKARELALAAGGHFLDGSSQPVCVEVHARTTARELLATVAADGGRIDAFGVGVGSGATFTAVARVVRAAHPQALLFAVEPAAAPIVSGGALKPHRLEGLATSAALLDRALVQRTIAISDEAAWALRERLGKEEGLLLGLAGAASVAGALEVARGLPREARVYTVCADSGERAFSLSEQF